MAVDTGDLSPEISLAPDRLMCFDARIVSLETPKIFDRKELTLNTGRGNLKNVGGRYQIFVIKDRVHFSGYHRTVLNGHTTRLIDKHTDHRGTLITGYLTMNQ